MANERNKILPYALSAIEGVNIQSQEDYSASLETTGGVSTGLANGNNFNKLAKQVSIMSSSLAEFIVNTLSEQTISDTNSIDEISSALNNAILKLIKDNEPVIPDLSGIKVIDNTSSTTDFNEIIETGIYYIFKDLQNKPIYSNKNFGILIVLNTENTVKQFFSFFEEDVPSQINSNYCSREKTGVSFSSWNLVYGISFKNNEIIVDELNPTSSATFPIFELINNKKQIKNATRSQMREKLGIADSPDLTDYFNKTTDKLNLATQVTGQLKNANIADNAITTSKIASLAITADKLASNSITNAKIANGAVTDAKFSGTLSVAKGGTGTNDGFGWKNTYLDAEFNAKIGLSYPFTTQQLASAIINLKQPVFCMVYGWRKGENVITDFPSSDLTHRTIINVADNNQFYLETIDPFNLTTYICNVSGGVAGKWIKTRNGDGTLPANVFPDKSDATSDMDVWVGTYSGELVKRPMSTLVDYIQSKSVITYTNDQGTWTETKLSDGTTMLEGGNRIFYVNVTEGKLTINYPKNIKEIITCWGISGSTGKESPIVNATLNNIAIYSQLNNIVFWGVKAILA